MWKESWNRLRRTLRARRWRTKKVQSSLCLASHQHHAPLSSSLPCASMHIGPPPLPPSVSLSPILCCEQRPGSEAVVHVDSQALAHSTGSWVWPASYSAAIWSQYYRVRTALHMTVHCTLALRVVNLHVCCCMFHLVTTPRPFSEWPELWMTTWPLGLERSLRSATSSSHWWAFVSSSAWDGGG